MCGIAVYPDCVKLFFGQGAQLTKSDPKQLLHGSGKLARYVTMNAVTDFDRAEIEVLIAGALKLAKLRLDPSAKGSMIVRAEEQKQRARAARRAPPDRPLCGGTRKPGAD